MHFPGKLHKSLIIFFILKVILSKDINVNKEDMDLVSVESVFTEDSIQKMQQSMLKIPDEKWVSAALKDIAYYLRNHKFNEWDQRYIQKQEQSDLIGYFKAFVDPSLKSLHWKVHENCYKNFYKCIIYLHSVIETAPFTRNDDVTTILYQNLTSPNSSIIMKLDRECKDALLNADRTGLPFDGPVEKFQWRTTASYFMCWYTMLGTPALSMLADVCDNFAHCLDPTHGLRNYDPRADDRLVFACAMYSFCPDPCCPLKHVQDMQQCRLSEENPCYFDIDNITDRVCKMDRKYNQNFEDMISNRWNVSCYCIGSGFKWEPQFEMCVDINECLTEENNCDYGTESCLNLPGSFLCICKWGFEFDNNTSRCIETNIFKKNNKTHISEGYFKNIFIDLFKFISDYFGFHK